MALKLNGKEMVAWIPEQKDIGISKTAKIELSIIAPSNDKAGKLASHIQKKIYWHFKYCKN